VNQQLTGLVRRRAIYRCEYCLLPDAALPLPFQIDHVLAGKHGGETVEMNLALACPHCNRHKGPNIAGFDHETGQVVRLFNPRTDIWDEHFFVVGAEILGKTSIGRVTVDVLAINGSDQLILRNALMAE
jgi:HNH endonuclease